MSRTESTQPLLTTRIIELNEKDAVYEDLAERLCQQGREIVDKYPVKSRALAIAMVGVLAMPFLGLIPDSEKKLERLQMLIENQRAEGEKGAILAVDTSGLEVRMKRPGAQKEPVEQAVVEHLAQLHNTYRDWVEGNDELMGSLVIKVSVDDAGGVARVEMLASQLSDSMFVHTIVADVRSWRIPQQGGAEITVPLLFIPKGMDAQTVVQWERTIRGPRGGTPVPDVAKRPEPTSNIQPATWVTPLPQGQPAPQPLAIKAAVPTSPKPKVEAKPLVLAKAKRQLALRDHPRYSANTLREIDEETPLNILERRGDWVKVKLADGNLVGFVRKEYVTAPENG